MYAYFSTENKLRLTFTENMYLKTILVKNSSL